MNPILFSILHSVAQFHVFISSRTAYKAKKWKVANIESLKFRSLSQNSENIRFNEKSYEWRFVERPKTSIIMKTACIYLDLEHEISASNEMNKQTKKACLLKSWFYPFFDMIVINNNLVHNFRRGYIYSMITYDPKNRYIPMGYYPMLTILTPLNFRHTGIILISYCRH